MDKELIRKLRAGKWEVNRVLIQNTPTIIVPFSLNRWSIILSSSNANPIYWGSDNSITTSTGMTLAAGAAAIWLSLPYDGPIVQGPIWMISNAANVVAFYSETIVPGL